MIDPVRSDFDKLSRPREITIAPTIIWLQPRVSENPIDRLDKTRIVQTIAHANTHMIQFTILTRLDAALREPIDAQNRPL